MNDNEDTIVVFTARSPERIVDEDRHNPDHEFSDATEPHGTAFLLAKVSGVAPPNDASEPDRWLITISEYARINVPDVWDHGRNPVRYTTLAELGIEPEKLEFQPMPGPHNQGRQGGEGRRESFTAPKGMTIEEAKRGIALTFGVKPEAVEITIRG
jgi:hypothetical protein